MDLLADIELVCFDLFDTLVRVDAARLPRVEIAGRPRPTTAPRVFEEVLAPRAVCFDEFVAAAVAASAEVAAEKERRQVEISSRVRFERVVRRLGIAEDDAEVVALAAQLAASHARHLARATVAAPGARRVLGRVRSRGLPTALCSNFDYARATDWILEHTGLAGALDHLAVSEDVGVRKPHEGIFRAALAPFGAEPQAALHVGDLGRSDVWGAGRLGLRTVWVNPAGAPYAEGEHPPALTVASLRELLDHL